MATPIHFFPQFPQGNLDMPPGAAARLPVSGGYFSLFFLLEIVSEQFFLFLLGQPGQCCGKVSVFQYSGLPAGSKESFFVRLCKIFVCGAERDKLLKHQIFKGKLPLPPAAQLPALADRCMEKDNPAKGVVRVSDMFLIL